MRSFELTTCTANERRRRKKNIQVFHLVVFDVGSGDLECVWKIVYGVFDRIHHAQYDFFRNVFFPVFSMFCFQSTHIDFAEKSNFLHLLLIQISIFGPCLPFWKTNVRFQKNPNQIYFACIIFFFACRSYVSHRMHRRRYSWPAQNRMHFPKNFCINVKANTPQQTCHRRIVTIVLLSIRFPCCGSAERKGNKKSIFVRLLVRVGTPYTGCC